MNGTKVSFNLAVVRTRRQRSKIAHRTNYAGKKLLGACICCHRFRPPLGAFGVKYLKAFLAILVE